MRLVGASIVVALGTLACQEPPPASPPDAGTPPATPPPSWDGAELKRPWLREGLGEAFALRAADLDHDGSDEILFGGRGLAAIDATSRAKHVPRWSVDWDPGANPLSGGDNAWVYAMDVFDATGDGVPDALVVSSEKDGYLVDGATGEKRWRTRFDAEFLTARAAFFDGDADGVPDVFPVGGKSAYSGRTGEKLWSTELPHPAVFAVSAELDGAPGRELVVTTEPDSLVGFPENPPENPPSHEEAVFGVAHDGARLFSFAPSDTVSALAAADLDGDGIDEVLVGTWKGEVVALGASGAKWQQQVGTERISALAAFDVDGDGKAEVFAAVASELGTESPILAAFAHTGTPLWTMPVSSTVLVLEPAQLDADPGLELLVAGGDGERKTAGMLVAVEPAAADRSRVKWRVDVGQAVNALALAKVDGQRVIVFGGADAMLWAVKPEDGARAWSWTSGGFVFAAASGDVDGDGLDEVASGDSVGLVALSDPKDGHERWSRRLEIGHSGQVNRVAMGDLDGDGRAEVVAVGARFLSPGSRGVLTTYEASGVPLLSKVLESEAMDVLLADVDGDRRPELVVAEVDATGCAVSARDQRGEVVWRTVVNTSCEVPRIAATDLDHDGKAEIAYGDVTLWAPPRLALIGSDGSVKWNVESGDDTTWLGFVPGGLVHAGFSSELRGHVSRRKTSDGSTVWRTWLPAKADPERPDGMPIDGGSFYGAIVPDLDGDGAPEIVASADTGEVRLLGGAQGEIRWTTSLDPDDTPSLGRHFAGPVAWVPASARVPAHLVVAHSSMNRLRSRIFVVKPDGAVVASIPTEGEGHAATTARLSPGRFGAAVGAGLGVYAVEVNR